jgi:HlyD family secretion protein
MDTEELEARLRQALAEIRQAEDAERVARADVATKAAQIDSRRSEITAKQAEFTYAAQQYKRSRELVGRGAVSEQEAQIDASHTLSTRAQVAGARAELASAQADLTGAQAMDGRSGSTIAAAVAEADRIRAQIRDAVLVAPLRGRVESRLAEPGEVLAAGGRVFSVTDLSDVYMYVFLPERALPRMGIVSVAASILNDVRSTWSGTLGEVLEPPSTLARK